MHPVLLRIGSFSLSTYGVAMALGFLVAILLGMRLARRQGISVNALLDLFFWILVSSLVGARLLFVLLNLGQYLRICTAPAEPRTTWQAIYDCTRGLHLWEGGFTYFGGFIAALAVSLWYSRRHGLSFVRVADLCTPLLALGHFFGRLGCFFAGCCYGKATTSALGVPFPPQSLAFQEMVVRGTLALTAGATPALHPTQLYEALTELCIFAALMVVVRRKRYHGQLLVLYLLLYPAARAMIELFRGDPDRRYLVELATPTLNQWLGVPPESPSLVSFSQALAVLAIAVAVLLHRTLRRRSQS
jgi:phosphatidylglycerol:prolipoprotein diacylglycerol transferase